MVKTERIIVTDKAAAPRTKARTGRPPVNGVKAMSKAERQRRYRARKRERRAAPSIQEQMEGVSGESILQELIKTRGLQSDFHKAVAAKAADALARESPRDATAWLELLPQVRIDASGRSMGAQAARDQLFELVTNAIAADMHDLRRRAEKGERLSEADALRLRLAEIDEGAPERAVAPPVPLPGLGAATLPAGAETAPLAAGATGAQPVVEAVRARTGPKVLTPSIGDIVPPGERTDKPPDPPLRQAKPPVVIDNPPQPRPADPTKTGGFDASEHGRLWREYCRTHPEYDVLIW
jgi:hypothetical protein